MNDAARPLAAPLGATLRDGGLALAWILAAATILRVVGLNEQLWLDEVLLLNDFVRASLAKTVASYPNDNNHPLYSALASLSARAFGETAWALRLPAALAGVLSIAALYAFARRLTSRGVSLAAAALMAVSYHHVFFSQNARGYTALLFCTLAASRSFLRARDGEAGAATPLAVALGFGAYAHLTGAFVGIAQALTLSLVRPTDPRGAREAWRGVLGGGAFAILLHAPMASDLWTFFVARPDRAALKTEWTNPLRQAEAALLGFGIEGATLGIAAALIGGAVVSAGLVRLWRRDRAAVLSGALPALLGASATVALGRHLWPRFFFFAAGFAVFVLTEGLAFASGLLFRRSPRVRFAAAAALVAVSAATIPAAWRPKQDFLGARDAARAEAHVGARLRVFTVGLALWPYRYLYAPEFVPVALDAADRPTDDPSAIEAALSGPDRESVRVISCSPIFLRSRQPRIAALLESSFIPTRTWRGSMGRETDLTIHVPR